MFYNLVALLPCTTGVSQWNWALWVYFLVMNVRKILEPDADLTALWCSSTLHMMPAWLFNTKKHFIGNYYLDDANYCIDDANYCLDDANYCISNIEDTQRVFPWEPSWNAAVVTVHSSHEFIYVSSINPNEATICHIYFTMRVVGKLSQENETIILYEARAI